MTKIIGLVLMAMVVLSGCRESHSIDEVRLAYNQGKLDGGLEIMESTSVFNNADDYIKRMYPDEN